MARDKESPSNPTRGSAAGAQEPMPADVTLEIERVSRNDSLSGPAGAAVRSMLIGAVIVGGVVWLTRVLLGKARFGNGKKSQG